jgi:hypothetical protein
MRVAIDLRNHLCNCERKVFQSLCEQAGQALLVSAIGCRLSNLSSWLPLEL